MNSGLASTDQQYLIRRPRRARARCGSAGKGAFSRPKMIHALSDRRREVPLIHRVALPCNAVRNASGTLSLIPWERMMTSLFVYGIQKDCAWHPLGRHENPERQAQQRLD
jgi:hypothetical protein